MDRHVAPHNLPPRSDQEGALWGGIRAFCFGVKRGCNPYRPSPGLPQAGPKFAEWQSGWDLAREVLGDPTGYPKLTE